MTWKEQAREVILAVLRSARAEGVTNRREVLRRVDASYPFGPRSYYPYTAWLEVRRGLLFDGNETPPHLRGTRKPSEAAKLRQDGQPQLFEESS